MVAIFVSGDAPVHPIWPFLYSAGLGIAFLYYWPTLLALVSRAAPAKVNATLMGLAFMSLFISNNLIGWIGGFYEKMTPRSVLGNARGDRRRRRPSCRALRSSPQSGAAPGESI